MDRFQMCERNLVQVYSGKPGKPDFSIAKYRRIVDEIHDYIPEPPSPVAPPQYPPNRRNIQSLPRVPYQWFSEVYRAPPLKGQYRWWVSPEPSLQGGDVRRTIANTCTQGTPHSSRRRVETGQETRKSSSFEKGQLYRTPQSARLRKILGYVVIGFGKNFLFIDLDLQTNNWYQSSSSSNYNPKSTPP
ncbi:hypothetical protein LXL04_015145 [Taraxacum kok-saghyz]